MTPERGNKHEINRHFASDLNVILAISGFSFRYQFALRPRLYLREAIFLPKVNRRGFGSQAWLRRPVRIIFPRAAAGMITIEESDIYRYFLFLFPPIS